MIKSVANITYPSGSIENGFGSLKLQALYLIKERENANKGAARSASPAVMPYVN